MARPQGASPEAGSATFNVALEAWGRRAGAETETSEAEKETQKGRAAEKGEMKRERCREVRAENTELQRNSQQNRGERCPPDHVRHFA